MTATTATKPTTRDLHRDLFAVHADLERRFYQEGTRTKAELNAIYLAFKGIDYAEETIRNSARWIRDDLESADRHLSEDLNMNNLGVLGRKPAELDMAVAARQIHWEYLAALLTEDEMNDFRAARFAVQHPDETAQFAYHLRTVHQQRLTQDNEQDPLFLGSLHRTVIDQNPHEGVSDGPRACHNFRQA